MQTFDIFQVDSNVFHLGLYNTHVVSHVRHELGHLACGTSKLVGSIHMFSPCCLDQNHVSPFQLDIFGYI